MLERIFVRTLIFNYIFHLVYFSFAYDTFDRLSTREETYFSYIQPYQHHTSIPEQGSNIYVYSFALQPEEHQPSGTCNFSRIKSVKISSTQRKGIKVYCRNYNVLNIVSGMAGLVFAM